MYTCIHNMRALYLKHCQDEILEDGSLLESLLFANPLASNAKALAL
jgi:hypothetical protein